MFQRSRSRPFGHQSHRASPAGSRKFRTGKKTPGGAGTHTGHSDTRITQTNLTSAIQTSPTHDPGKKTQGGSREPGTHTHGTRDKHVPYRYRYR